MDGMGNIVPLWKALFESMFVFLPFFGYGDMDDLVHLFLLAGMAAILKMVGLDDELQNANCFFFWGGLSIAG